jgi:hypothetical protein
MSVNHCVTGAIKEGMAVDREKPGSRFREPRQIEKVFTQSEVHEIGEHTSCRSHAFSRLVTPKGGRMTVGENSVDGG